MNKLKVFAFYVGIAVFIGGVLLAILWSDAEGVTRILPFVMVGCGTGAIGGGVSYAIIKPLERKHPELAKTREINEKDERNIRL